jgi:hypothetical protein
VTPQSFQDALRRLVDDEQFAQSVQQDPDVLTSNYTLSQQELDVLATIWRTAHPDDEQVSAAAVIVACYVACKTA